MIVTIHIDRVILDDAIGNGVREDQLAQAIGAELAERIAAGGLPAQLRSSSMRPEGPSTPMHKAERAPSPGGLGADIGATLYGSLNK